MKRKSDVILFTAVIAALFAAAVFTSLFIVNEGEQTLVIRFGKIKKSYTDAGVHVKVPFIDKTIFYPKRILSLDGDDQRIPTKENQFIIVDTTSRWYISDAAKFYQSFATVEDGSRKLADVVNSACRTVITQNRLVEIVRSTNSINEEKKEEVNGEEEKEIESLVREGARIEEVNAGRNELCNLMVAEANRLLPEYGISLIDILPRQIKYSDELTEAVYSRMIKERTQVAKAYRSLGEGKRAEWMGKLEHDRLEVSSAAYAEAERIKGEADAKASRIYSESFSRDKEFYAFYKSMESYLKTLKGSSSVYSTDMEYFKYLYTSEGR